MKILFGITKSNFGGAQHYVFDLATESRKAGHDVVVMCGGNGPLVQKLINEKVRVISLPDFGRDISLYKDFISLLFILKTVFKEKPDIFHINSAKMGGAGIFSGRILGVNKIIFTAHGWAFNEPRPVWQKFLIKFFSWATIIFAHKTICVSEQTRNQVINLPFAKNKTVVVHNGIKEFDLLPRTNSDFTFGTIAELHKIKGLDILLNAWAIFIQNYQAKLVIYGSGEEKDNLIKLANDLNISNSVIFKGFVDNARSQLSTFDIFLIPSRSEGLPYAILEAGAVELPVIATNVGGIPEIIVDEKNGLLVKKENASQLVQAMIRLMDNKELREKLGTNLKHTVATKFSFDSMIRQTFELYVQE
jgi:glycosyltransferase involved in cell wall biosynthesis